MFNPILVPLDGSQLAECVLPHIVAIAHSFDSEIILLRMLEKNPSGASVQLFDLLNWQINKTKAALYLEKKKGWFHESSLQARVMVLEGLVAEGIVESAQIQGVELIVLSSHGHAGVTQWGLSSITQKITLSTPTSLLIVRANQIKVPQPTISGRLHYQHILVPLDGSQRAENVLPVITQLARYHKSQIHLVQVVQTPEMARQMPPSREDIELTNQVIERNQEEAGHYLAQLSSRSYLEGIALQTHLLTSDKAEVALHQLVEQEQIDLVALSAHGHSGILQWPYGSLVNNFIMYGKVPLLIVQDLPSRLGKIPPEDSSAERAER